MRLSPWKKQVQQVKFDRNGTVSTSEGNSGEWWFDVGGLYWVSNGTGYSAGFSDNGHHRAIVEEKGRAFDVLFS